MRAALPLIFAALFAANAAGGRTAWAAGPRLVLDRADAQASWLPGYARLRLFVTAVNLEGSVIPVVGERPFEVRLSGSLAREPVLAGRYGGTGEELAVALVIERGFEYADDLGNATRAAGQFLEKLPKRTRVAVIDYGADVQGSHRVQPKGTAAHRLDGLLADPAPADPRLLDAMKRALRTLRRAKPETEGAPLRLLIVVVSDGKNIDPAPDGYRKLGKRAARYGIRIHSIAYSPVDNRKPLLGLGELSKRSGGTFRWVRSREGFSGQFRTLLDEIGDQYVLTFLLPKDEVTGKRVEVHYRQLTSNPLRVRELSCGEAACAAGEMCVAHHCVTRPRAESTGALGWIIRIVCAIVGLLALLLLIGFLLSKAQARRQARAQAALAAAGQEQPAGGGHRIVGVDPQAGGHRIAGVDPHAGAVPPGRAPSQAQVQPQAPAPASPAAAAPPPAAAGAAQPALYIVKGRGQGTRIPIVHGLLIGTAKNCHIRLEGDAFASSHHAQVVMDTAGGCTVVDRGSTNGTFVNGVRTPQMRLKHGMLIKVGATELRFLEK